MYLPQFNFHQPVSVGDALGLLEKKSNSVAMAGGTDLLVEMKKGLRQYDDIISLSKIDALKLIAADDNNLYVGACATHNEIISSALVQTVLPVLAEAASKIGSDQVRNTGTIGGNLCTAASCCDSAPILLALNASVEMIGPAGKRALPLSAFFTFNKKTVLKKGELVTRVIIPKPVAGTGAVYEKFGLREAGSISVVSVAVKISVEQGKCVDACVVIGAVAPTPKISTGATETLIGRRVDELLQHEALLEETGNAAVKDSIPIDDIRGGAQYRRDVLKVLVKRAVQQAIQLAVSKVNS